LKGIWVVYIVMMFTASKKPNISNIIGKNAWLHPPLEWLASPPLVAAVSIAPKGTESPGSGCMGVIGALVLFFPSEAVSDKLHSPWAAQ